MSLDIFMIVLSIILLITILINILINIKYNKKLNIIIILFLIILYFYVLKSYLYKNNEHFQNINELKNINKKTIWLLWLQGWDNNVPLLIQMIKYSWIKQNSDWNIELVSEDNLKNYISIPNYYYNIPTPQAKSDYIRLALLATYGGVWADASLPCLISLDLWIYDALEPVGFWMYHGRDRGNGPASWFIISIKQSYIIQTWRNECENFWKLYNPGDILEYYWMDYLFNDLMKNDLKFLDEWKKVPYIWCESKGQSHYLMQNNNIYSDDQNIKNIFIYNPPYVVKLTRCNIEEIHDKVINTVLDTALNQKYAPYPLHEMKIILKQNHDFTNNVIVLADCGNIDDIITVNILAKKYGYKVIVYDKCKFCNYVPEDSNIFCRPLRNVGREQHTFLYFVLTYYDNLPNNIILTPTNFKKHPIRYDLLLKILENSNDIDNTYCINYKMSNDWLKNFTLDHYEGSSLEKSDIRPLKDWYTFNVKDWNENKDILTCWNGIMRTTRDKILKKEKNFYYNIYLQLSNNNNPEVGHYMERSMGDVFA